MSYLQKMLSRSQGNIECPSLAVVLRTFAAAAALTAVSADGVSAQSVPPACNSRHGSAVIICGVNGGTSSQIFSPGSVIIMRQDALAFPSDLPDSSLPEEVAAAREGMTFLARRSTAGGDITWSLTGFGVSRDQSGTDLERGYSSDRGGIIAGMRVERPGYTLFFGVDASSESQDYERDSVPTIGDRIPIPVPPASVDREDFGLSLGGSAELRPGLVWHVAGRVGRIDIDTRRVSYDLHSTDGTQADPDSNIERTLIGRGSTEGLSISAQTGLSYGQPLGSGFYGGVSGSLVYVHEDFDEFTELLPDGNEGFTIGDDTRKSLLSRIGVEVARPLYVDNAIVVPSVRIAWLHEFSDDSRTIDIHAPQAFTGDDFGAPYDFTISTSEPDRNYFTVGASLGVLFSDGRGSLAVDYEAIVGHDFIDEHMVGLRIGYRF